MTLCGGKVRGNHIKVGAGSAIWVYYIFYIYYYYYKLLCRIFISSRQSSFVFMKKKKEESARIRIFSFTSFYLPFLLLLVSMDLSSRAQCYVWFVIFRNTFSYFCWGSVRFGSVWVKVLSLLVSFCMCVSDCQSSACIQLPSPFCFSAFSASSRSEFFSFARKRFSKSF